MYICEELMDKINSKDINAFLKEIEISPNDEKYPKNRKRMFEELILEGIIDEETLSSFFYRGIMCGEHRLIRVYKLSERCCNLLRNRSSWDDFMHHYDVSELQYNLILTPLKYKSETAKLVYIKSFKSRLKSRLARIDMIYAFKILKSNKETRAVEELNLYLPVTIDLINHELIIKVCNQSGILESSRPKKQLDAVFDELKADLKIELNKNKVRPETVLYDMSRELFNNFYRQLPNIKELDEKRNKLCRVVDLLLQDIKLNHSQKEADGMIHIDPNLIDLEDELYKLLQQTVLLDYLETGDLESLLPDDTIYISKIRFSDQDNLEASLTGENGKDCIYDKRTFMGIRNSLDIVKRIVSMRVIFPQKKGNLTVKYDGTDDKFIGVHILDSRHYNQDELNEAWELYRVYERQRINKDMLAKSKGLKSSAI